MTAKQRKLRRQQIDALFVEDRISAIPPRPAQGWIQSVREALGMTLDTFGARLGLSKQGADQLERAEAKDAITLKRLRAAASALECELVILLQPKRSLEQMVRDRALAVAREMVTRTGRSMAMEEQGLSSPRLAHMIEETADELIESGETRIWQ